MKRKQSKELTKAESLKNQFMSLFNEIELKERMAQKAMVQGEYRSFFNGWKHGAREVLSYFSRQSHTTAYKKAQQRIEEAR